MESFFYFHQQLQSALAYFITDFLMYATARAALEHAPLLLLQSHCGAAAHALPAP